MDKIEVILSNSHVNNQMELSEISMINLLQDIEGIHIHSLGSFTKYLRANNLGVFLTYRQIDVIKKPKFAQKVILTTYPFNTRATSGFRHIFIYDEDHNPLVLTTSFGVFVNLANNQVTRLPKEIVETINDQEQDPNVIVLPRKIKVDNNIHQLLDKVRIRKSHIDRYNHVNNSHYVAFALNSINEEIKYDRIRAEYLNSFVLNDVCFIYLAEKTATKTTFTLENDKNEVYAIIEFSEK